MKITEEGFIWDRNVGTSLTWMDAKIGDYAVTDRSGLAVEIQMLWYNLLKIGVELKQVIKVDRYRHEFNELADKLESHFIDRFWNDDAGCLFDLLKPASSDTLEPMAADSAIRPNQTIGMALPFTMLTEELSQVILRVVERELLTDVGLRTLNQDHPNYKKDYSGPQLERDHAYHQGTVWPFLLGHYLLAYLRAHSFSKDAQAYTRRKLDSFYRHLKTTEIAYVPEIYSAQDLRPEGCISQAWSVATMLEVVAKLD